MRFRADVLCHRERVSERCVRGVRAVVGYKCFAITGGLLYGTHDENTAWCVFVDAIRRVANEFSPQAGMAAATKYNQVRVVRSRKL